VRVAFITVGDTSRLTGGYLYHARVFERLGDHGVGVEEIVPSGASAAEQKDGIRNLAVFDPREYDAVVVDALARVVVAPFIEAWRKESPVVAMVHELPSLAAPDGDAGEGRAFEDALLGADMFIAVSDHGKSALEGRGVPAERVRVVSPGFDGFSPESAERRIRSAPLARRAEFRPDAFAGEDRDRSPKPPGLGGGSARPGVLRALCVAQWIPRKGVLDLVEAWKMANAPNAALRLVGETDADPEYASKVMAAIGGETSISVAGTLDDASLAAAYADSDLFVLPSRFEGYGVVYAEALSFGLPVVACRVGPIPEIVGPEAGFFASPGDVPGISDAIRALLSDANLRERMSEAALRRVGELPRWDDTARDFAEVLREARRG
jgi:glycosyltransferase involved in cell wall biosynthesis